MNTSGILEIIFLIPKNSEFEFNCVKANVKVKKDPKGNLVISGSSVSNYSIKFHGEEEPKKPVLSVVN
jgi:hypothetical protein